MGTDMQWRARAMCDGLEPNEMDAIFFPHPLSAATEAKAICKVCPVVAECLDYALNPETRQDHGVWGGLTERERSALLRTRARPSGATKAAVVSVNEPTTEDRCGTYAGVRAHRKRAEWLCDPCRDARAIYENDRRRKVAARGQEMSA